MRKLALIFLLATAAPAFGATPPVPAQTAPGAQQQLDKLFKQLAKAGSSENAHPVEAAIFIVFVQSGSPSIDLLMQRAAIAMKAGNNDVAEKIMESVTDIAPGFAEGWHVRGQLAQSVNNDEAAIAYLSKAIALNPRHFQACSELAEVLMEYGDKKQALIYMRRAQSLDPWLEGLDKQIEKVARDVEGEKI